MTDAPRAVRRHVLFGAVAAALCGVVCCFALLASGRSAAQGALAERRAIVALRSVADVVARAGVTGEAVRAAVERIAAADETLRGARVVVGRTVEASTLPGETAPRDLERESAADKELFDTGQKLRAAVATNREEEATREPEIAIVTLEDGRLRLATAVEIDGEVAGFAEIETAFAPAAPAAPPLLPLALLLLVPPLAAFLLGRLPVLGERRVALTVAVAVVFLGVLVFVQRSGADLLVADARASERSIAAEVAQRAARVESTLAALELTAGAPMDSASWDSDIYRRPRGAVDAAGSLDERRLADVAGDLRDRFLSLSWASAILALLLLAWFGTGGAAWTWRTLTAHRTGYAYVAPAMIAMIVLVFVPFGYGLLLSFTGQTIYTTDKSIPEVWVGLQNFIDILSDFRIATHGPDGWSFNYQNFYWTLGWTIIWTVVNVSIGVTLGLCLALILNTKGLRLRPVYRVLLILPWAVPNYITALTWKGMFHQQFGVVNQFFQLLGLPPVSWFESPLTSAMTVIATNGWLSFPFMMVISLGALQSISADLYEAARVDGATRWKQFTSITLPSLKPALVPAVILSFVWTFNMFNIIYLVSAGEPAHSTEILITQAYKLAFEQYRYGYAAAYATIIFLILLLYGTFQNRVTRATEGI